MTCEGGLCGPSSGDSSSSTAGEDDGSASDGTTPDLPEPDPDADGDGFSAALDCDDNDESTIPLLPNQVRYATSSLTICPGVYYGSRVFVQNSSGVILDGEGAILDMEGAYFEDEVEVNGVIDISDSSNIEVVGFEIRNYSNHYTGIGIRGSNEVEVHGVHIHGYERCCGESSGQPLSGIDSMNSSRVTVADATVSGAGSGIIFNGSGVENDVLGPGMLVENTKAWEALVFPSAIIINTTEGLIADVECSGGGVWIFKNNTLVNSQIHSDRYEDQGIFAVGGDGPLIQNNTVWGFEWGAYVIGPGGSLIGNEFSGNTYCYHFDSGEAWGGTTMNNNICP